MLLTHITPRTTAAATIAVMPFANLSGDPDQNYFADGMVEELITALSRFKSFAVVSRTSTFAYKGKAVTAEQVSKELGVRYILEGSVQRAGEQLRINAQLVDSQSGGHAWAGKFDGTLADVKTQYGGPPVEKTVMVQPSLYDIFLQRVGATGVEPGMRGHG